MSDTYTNLTNAIRDRFLHHVADTDVPPDSIPEWVAVLTQFVDDSMAKFADGQREHGGDLRTRPPHLDIRPEIIDIMFYHLNMSLHKPTQPTITL